MATDNTNPCDNVSETIKYAAPFTRVLRSLAGFRMASYASDVGEATRGTFPNVFVNLMYGVTVSYIGTDLYFRYRDNQHLNQTNQNNNCTGPSMTPLHRYMGYHTLWHLQASLLFPTMTIHTIVNMTKRATDKMNFIKPNIRRFVPAAVSLAVIPFIIHPLDKLADNIMKYTYCAHTGFEPEENKH
ncbi:18 kDa protein [Moumouvirus goulette]|uniref:18 kDa protein n=1 Tax=Moumouvirus goulette TaxID=1247379 RepID=M1NLS5_9VIRU|nr:18 kDa protein [Moumouvirus goulette]AGF84940.1 18 kDa protein [Moumouvirus goulette]